MNKRGSEWAIFILPALTPRKPHKLGGAMNRQTNPEACRMSRVRFRAVCILRRRWFALE